MRRTKVQPSAMEARASMSWTFEVVRVRGAARLVTFDIRDGQWVGRSQDESPSGAIVRVVPHGDDFDRAAAKAALMEAGALHVWFAPREGKRQAVPASKERAPAAPTNVRQVVAELVLQANTKDRDRLSAVVDAALDAAGV